MCLISRDFRMIKTLNNKTLSGRRGPNTYTGNKIRILKAQIRIDTINELCRATDVLHHCNWLTCLLQ